MSKTENVTEYIMQYMKEQIANGTWKVGEKIPSENDLCEKLGYSRTSVRSALQKYNVLGILRSEKGRGTFVCSDQVYIPDGLKMKGIISEDKNGMQSYMEWRQARNLIEPEIVYRVAQTASDELIEKLRRINQEQHNAIGNSLLYNQKDIEFHMAIVEAYGNPIITNIMHQLLENHNMMTYGNDQFGFLGGIYYHVLITDAIIRHDAKEARDLMLDHGLQTKKTDSGEKREWAPIRL